MTITRRGFLQTAAVTPFTIQAMASSFQPTEEQIERWGGQWANGVPFWSGWRACASEAACGGQWVVGWHPNLVLGSKLGGSRDGKAQFFYAASKADMLDIESPERVEALVARCYDRLVAVFENEAKWDWTQWNKFRMAVRHMRSVRDGAIERLKEPARGEMAYARG